MFIWDFVAAKVLGQIVDWFYSQIVGFLGNFFSEMGNMGAELFTMDWVQSIVLFFSYLAWALYGTGLVVACFETGVEYSSGRGNIRETALNAIKGFMAVSLFTVVPVRLYELCVSLQGTFTAALTGYGSSIGDVAGEVMQEFNAVESISDLTAGPLLGFGSITSGIMILFCIILMAYAIIKVFFANLKRGGILLIQIAVGSLYMFSVPRGYTDGFIIIFRFVRINLSNMIVPCKARTFQFLICRNSFQRRDKARFIGGKGFNIQLTAVQFKNSVVAGFGRVLVAAEIHLRSTNFGF